MKYSRAPKKGFLIKNRPIAPEKPFRASVSDLAPPGSLVLDTAILGLLVVPGAAERSQELQQLADRAAAYATRARGEGTLRAYRSAWTGFSDWCSRMERQALPAEIDLISLYVTSRADRGHAVSSIRVALSAIKTAHMYAGMPLDMRDPRLAMVMDGIARSRGTKPKRQAAAAVPDTMRKFIKSLDSRDKNENAPECLEVSSEKSAKSIDLEIKARNRAMLLIGFGGALRRSELVALMIGDVEMVDDRGLAVTIQRSKTDQYGQSQIVGIWANDAEPDLCPVVALKAWLLIRQDKARLRSFDKGGLEDPLFCGILKNGHMSGRAMADKIVSRILKKVALDTGFDPKKFSGHSLRRGLLTAAGDLRLPLRDVMKHSRHKSVETALGYMESGEVWNNNITEDIMKTGRKRD
jgi:integrase